LFIYKKKRSEQIRRKIILKRIEGRERTLAGIKKRVVSKGYAAFKCFRKIEVIRKHQPVGIRSVILEPKTSHAIFSEIFQKRWGTA
jgi:hypothetical protein